MDDTKVFMSNLFELLTVQMSYNMVRMCNQLVSLRLHCKNSSKQDPLEVRHLAAKTVFISS